MFLCLNQENVEEGKGEWRALLPWQSSLGYTPHILLRAPLHPNHKAPALQLLFLLSFFPISVLGAQLPWGLPWLLSVRLGAAKTMCQFTSWRSHRRGICSPSLQEMAAGWQETNPICTSLAAGFDSGGSSLCSLEMRWRNLSDVKVFSLLLCPVSHGSCCHC